MADWATIKAEYITTPDTSYRKLAEKYGVHYQTIAERAKKEGWAGLREIEANSALTKTLTAVRDVRADRACKLMGVADLLLEKIRRLLERDEDMSTQSMRNIGSVLRDIQQVQMIRSDADTREQNARIAKLEREARGGNADGEIRIEIAGELEEFAQ